MAANPESRVCEDLGLLDSKTDGLLAHQGGGSALGVVATAAAGAPEGPTRCSP